VNVVTTGCALWEGCELHAQQTPPIYFKGCREGWLSRDCDEGGIHTSVHLVAHHEKFNVHMPDVCARLSRLVPTVPSLVPSLSVMTSAKLSGLRPNSSVHWP
jgi:hypothetical protein